MKCEKNDCVVYQTDHPINYILLTAVSRSDSPANCHLHIFSILNLAEPSLNIMLVSDFTAAKSHEGGRFFLSPAWPKSNQQQHVTVLKQLSIWTA